MPKKLHELQRLWLIEATRYNVVPFGDRHLVISGHLHMSRSRNGAQNENGQRAMTPRSKLDS